MIGGKPFGNESAVRTGINFLDHGVFLGRVERRWMEDDTANIGVTVAPFRHESFWLLPTGRRQSTGVCSFEVADQLAVAGPAQFGDGRRVNSRIGVDYVLAIW